MVASRNPTPSDRQGFNRRWFANNLARVYAPTSASDVVDAWSDIEQHGSGGPGATQITCGRHCYEDFVYRDETSSVIDVTGLRSFGDDPDYGLYIDAGYGNWDMYRIFNNVYDRTLPAGSCYSVGLGGHITGGGYGLLSRQFGLTVDHLTAVQLVVKRGPTPELVTASATENADLFWALRGGGGGNFGIITRYYFGDPPRSPRAFYSTALTIDWTDHAGAVQLSEADLGAILDMYSSAVSIGQGGPAADFDILHLNHQAAGQIVWAMYAFDVDHDGDADERAAFVAQSFADRRELLCSIAALSDEPGPINGHPWHGTAAAIMPPDPSDPFRQYTFLEGVQETNGSGPNQFGKYKSAYMNAGFTPTMVSALWNGLTTTPSGADMSSSLCQIDSYGCAINQVAADATPIPQRESIMKLQYQTYWNNDGAIGSDAPVQQAAHVDWINEMYTNVYGDYGGFPDPRRDPAGVVDGCYFNYCDNELGVNGVDTPGIDHALYLYFKDNASANERNLVAIKRDWNPENWFAGPQSIPV